MRIFVLGFVGGSCWLQQQAVLPAWTLLWLLILGSILAVTLPLKKSVLAARLLVLGFVLGFVWAAGAAHWRMADALPADVEGQDVVVTGMVTGLPQAMERGLRFELALDTSTQPVPSHISLAWYRTDLDDTARDASLGLGGLGVPHGMLPTLPVRSGETWRFTVRLKRPHGNLNPQGFDYEAWLLERGIRATGYVRARAEIKPERLPDRTLAPRFWVDAAREALRDRYHASLGDAPFAGILIALAIGDQQAIDPELWQVFAKTGITHLMSISGLHVTMLAGLAYVVMNWLWRRSSRLPLYLPAPQAAAIAGFLAAFAYSLLAGFAVPAQRTLYMLGVVALSLLLRREMAASRVLALALLLVLLLDPWAVLAAGFWLSFGAVALLFYIGNGRLGNVHWLRDWGRAQWAVTIGMLPALLALFQQFSLVSPLANAVGIPVVSLAVTPLALVGALPGFGLLLQLAHGITASLMSMMEFLARQPWAVWQQAAPPAWAVLLALLGGAWLLLPRGFPARWLGLVCFLPLLTVMPARPLAGAAQVVVLDVGQGLAIHVQTARHDLLFDAGPAFSAEANSGNRIIVPYLRARGVRRLDRMIVSHADKDHEGGAAAVLGMIPVAELMSSLPFEHPLSVQPAPHRSCVAGENWEWDGVRFEMLHPPEDLSSDRRARKTNAMSCVLAIEAGGKRMLLTSDIEAEQEALLLAQRPASLKADVVTMPHHGSRTSSTAEFIAATWATEAVIPVGYRSRFGHPRPEVVARWEASGARLHRTDLDGAVSVNLGTAGINVEHERERRQRYWHGQ
jgi:competence protein ComEC